MTTLPQRDRTHAYVTRTVEDLEAAPFEFVQFMIDTVPVFAAVHAAVRLDVFELLAHQEMTDTKPGSPFHSYWQAQFGDDRAFDRVGEVRGEPVERLPGLQVGAGP
ncbi:hypothetical protein ACTMTI_56565 [Nonomuraea sp. H19]|uniref:hypothetical protein n=1 Tax=Nonomuraea sp. H19 TaxID=3452206 RepID=UPI003F89C415